MTKIDRLRNEFVDAMARCRWPEMGYEAVKDKIEERDKAARRLIEAKDAETSNTDVTPRRTGWFTAYVYPRTEKDVRLRRELRENGLVYTESGALVTNGLDPYTDIQWEDDAKQDPTATPSVRQYTEDEIQKAFVSLVAQWDQVPTLEQLIARLRRSR